MRWRRALTRPGSPPHPSPSLAPYSPATPLSRASTGKAAQVGGPTYLPWGFRRGRAGAPGRRAVESDGRRRVDCAATGRGSAHRPSPPRHASTAAEQSRQANRLEAAVRSPRAQTARLEGRCVTRTRPLGDLPEQGFRTNSLDTEPAFGAAIEHSPVHSDICKEGHVWLLLKSFKLERFVSVRRPRLVTNTPSLKPIK